MKFIRQKITSLAFTFVAFVFVSFCFLGFFEKVEALVSTNGLVGYWDFNEGSGTVANDLSGNNNTGTFSGNPVWTPGNIGSGSVSFDGVDDYIAVSDSASMSSLEGSNAVTISFWVKRNNTNGGGYVSRMGSQRLFDITSDIYFSLRPQWRYGGSGTAGSNIDHACSNAQCPLPVGSWYHVVVMYNNPTSYIYINGVLKSTKDGSGGVLNTDVSDSLKIGGRLSGYYNNVSIDDLRIYSRALSDAEILELFNGSNTGTQPPAPSGDTTAPVISNILVGSINQTSATVSWSTDETADSQVEYGTTVSYGSSTSLNTQQTTSHSQSITGLSANTLYHYRIKSKDASGNLVVSGDQTFSTSPVSGQVPVGLTTYTVKQDGTGNFTTIQACADTVQAGGTCLVYSGVYPEHVKTASGGTSDSNRVTFKAQGVVTMKGFDIKHQYITIEGFDIAGYGQQWSFNIQVMHTGSYCKIINNIIRDDSLSGGIGFVENGGLDANYCEVKGNTIKNLGYAFLSVDGSGHLFENNTLSRLNSRDFILLMGNNSVFRRNIFLDGNTIQGVGNHPDWVQTFGNEGSDSYNMLFEENWVQNLDSQMGQLNSQTDLTPTAPPVLSTLVHDWTFKNNVFINISANMNVSMPGVKFINNTFYKVSNQLSGIGYSGSLKRGDSSRGMIKNNVFVAGGSSPDPYGYRGYYSNSGALLSREVLWPLSSDQTIGSGIFDDLRTNGYLGDNGDPLDKAKNLTDISQFVLNSNYSSYKSAVYELLMKTVQLDLSIRSTFYADYNFVSEDYPLYAAKATSCNDSRRIGKNFCEIHGINGGDPRFQNVNDPMGADGIPFTADDGLIPTTGSPLCGKGEGGVDIGAYSCSSPGNTVPTPVPVVDTFPPNVLGTMVSNITQSGAKINWTTNESSTGSIQYGLTTGYGSNLNSSGTTSHTVTLTGLLPNTTYNYRITAKDGANNTTTTNNQTFTTLISGSTTPPTIPISTTPPTPTPPSSGGGGTPTVTPVSTSGGGGASQTPTAPTTPVQTQTPQQPVQPQTGVTTPTQTPKVTRPNITRTLTVGSKGGDVAELQTYLKALGYLPTGRADGNFGYLTRDAIQRYQCATLQICSGSTTTNGYGLVGSKTRAALLGTATTTPLETTVSTKPVSNGTGTTKLNITRTLYFGMRNTDVSTLQTFLISKGYLTQGNATGYFGNLTRQAVQKFQCDKLRICSGSSTTNGYGVVGPKTRVEMGR